MKVKLLKKIRKRFTWKWEITSWDEERLRIFDNVLKETFSPLYIYLAVERMAERIDLPFGMDINFSYRKNLRQKRQDRLKYYKELKK